MRSEPPAPLKIELFYASFHSATLLDSIPTVSAGCDQHIIHFLPYFL